MGEASGMRDGLCECGVASGVQYLASLSLLKNGRVWECIGVGFLRLPAHPGSGPWSCLIGLHGREGSPRIAMKH